MSESVATTRQGKTRIAVAVPFLAVALAAAVIGAMGAAQSPDAGSRTQGAAAMPAVALQSQLDFRAGERASLASAAADSSRAQLDFRAGERASLASESLTHVNVPSCSSPPRLGGC